MTERFAPAQGVVTRLIEAAWMDGCRTGLFAGLLAGLIVGLLIGYYLGRDNCRGTLA